MRTLLRITIPVEAGNRSIKDGSLPRTLNAVLAELRPEAAYFATQDGKRAAFVVFDLKEPAQIPSIAEPLFTAMNAEVEFCPVMTADELKTGLERASRKS